MTDALIGIIVGVTVALAGQVISYIFDRKKGSEEKHRQTDAVLRLLHRELEHHRDRYQGLLAWVQESIGKVGPAHTGYSYERIRTDAYEKVFLVYWHLLPDEVVESVMGYYKAVDTVNTLSASGDLYRGSPIPIAETKTYIERAQSCAHELTGLLERYVPAS
jgi:hypothetical protein